MKFDNFNGLAKEWFFRITIILISIILGIIISEVSLRWLIPPSKNYYVHIPHTTRRFRPVPGTMNGVEGVSRFTINSSGIRGAEFGESSENEYRILTFGGSTTECLYLDDTETWPYLLQEYLETTFDGRPVWVGNVGKAGANSRDHILQVKYLLNQYPGIDLLLVLVGINDLTVALAQGDQYSPPPPITDPEAEMIQLRRAFRRIPGRLPFTLIDPSDLDTAPWYKKTAIYAVLMEFRSRVGWLLTSQGWRQEFKGGWEYPPLRKKRLEAEKINSIPNLNKALDEYNLNLNTIVDLVEAKGAQVILVNQPVLWRVDLNPTEEELLWFGGKGDFLNEQEHPYYSTSVLVEGMYLFNQELLEVCESRGIDCIDLSTQIPSSVDNFYDDSHFTEEGAQLVASVISQHLKNTEPFQIAAGH